MTAPAPVGSAASALLLHLAQHDATGITAQVLKATKWDKEQVAGGLESFLQQGDAVRV